MTVSSVKISSKLSTVEQCNFANYAHAYIKYSCKYIDFSRAKTKQT